MTASQASAEQAEPRPPQASRRSIDQNLVVLVVLSIAASAWLLLALTHTDFHHSLVERPEIVQAPAAELGHDGHVHHDAESARQEGTRTALTHGLLGLLGWIFMVVAMMLPPAMPLLQTVRRLVSRRPNAAQLSSLAALIFVAVWTLVGVVLVASNLLVRDVWAGQGWAAGRPEVVTGAVLLFAGLYQFSPLKDLCLRRCRSPRSFALAHWHGRRSPAAEIVTMAGAYAGACVGCCWALMLICFAVGVAALPVMVALAVVMAAERLVPWGRALVRPVGLCLVVLGALTASDLLSGQLLVL